MASTEKNTKRLCITRRELPGMLGCGQYTADRIARQAGARVQIGKRVLIYVPKIEEYLRKETE